MRRITRLKREAIDSCKSRGHDMGRFASFIFTHTAECKKCKMWVQVDERPLPNGIEIGGTAVGRNCK